MTAPLLATLRRHRGTVMTDWLCPKCWRPWHQCLCLVSRAQSFAVGLAVVFTLFCAIVW